jgi:hypothetical protein
LLSRFERMATPLPRLRRYSSRGESFCGKRALDDRFSSFSVDSSPRIPSVAGNHGETNASAGRLDDTWPRRSRLGTKVTVKETLYRSGKVLVLPGPGGHRFALCFKKKSSQGAEIIQYTPANLQVLF